MLAYLLSEVYLYVYVENLREMQESNVQIEQNNLYTLY